MYPWDVHSVNAKRMKKIIEEHTKMFETRVSLRATEKLSGRQNKQEGTVANSTRGNDARRWREHEGTTRDKHSSIFKHMSVTADNET